MTDSRNQVEKLGYNLIAVPEISLTLSGDWNSENFNFFKFISLDLHKSATFSQKKLLNKPVKNSRENFNYLVTTRTLNEESQKKRKRGEFGPGYWGGGEREGI